jgi:hypothetical protein
MARKQLTIDTSLDYETHRMSPNKNAAPQYCLKQDFLLKVISILLLAAFYIASLTITWLFSPMWATTSLIHRIMTFSCYSFVIVTTDLDEILNIKHSTNEKLVICRFVSYCDWIIAFVEIAEGLLRCLQYFIQYGGLLSPFVLYSSIVKFVLYVYLLRNV